MKILQIDLDKLIDKELDLNAYFFLYNFYNKDQKVITDYIKNCGKIPTTSFQKLVDLGYITLEEQDKFTFNNIKLTDKFEKEFIFGGNDPEDWIDQWYELWPKGVKSGGLSIRTDKNSCLKKLKTFIKENPQYNKGVIIGATKKYIERMKKNNFMYCKLAPYYISKDGISMLSGDCEELFNSVNTKDDFKGFVNDI